jgi:hypothetical protein
VGRIGGENEEGGLSSISFKVEGQLFPDETGSQNQHYPIKKKKNKEKWGVVQETNS